MGKTSALLPEKIRRKEYEEELRRLQVELVQMQRWIVQEHAKVCIVFEGRDTAGKGGVIKRLTERVSPRVFRVVALPAPNERERSQMYIQRYIPTSPPVVRSSFSIEAGTTAPESSRSWDFAPPRSPPGFSSSSPSSSRRSSTQA